MASREARKKAEELKSRRAPTARVLPPLSGVTREERQKLDHENADLSEEDQLLALYYKNKAEQEAIADLISRDFKKDLENLRIGTKKLEKGSVVVSGFGVGHGKKEDQNATRGRNIPKNNTKSDTKSCRRRFTPKNT